MKHDQNTEADLLASLGGKAQDVDTYEESVLKSAALDAAPKLTGLGFPDLAPLAPSHDKRRGLAPSRADLPHFHTLLRRVRGDLANMTDTESTQAQKLRMKEQMLLVYMEQVAHVKPEDMPTNLQREMKQDQARIKELAAANEPPPKETGSGESGNGEKAASAEPPSKGKKRKKSLMAYKQMGNKKNDKDTEERRAAMRQRRKERDERRKQRRQRWSKQQSSDEEAEFGASTSKGNMITDHEKKDGDGGDSGARVDVLSDEDRKMPARVVGAEQEEPSCEIVLCPLCNEPQPVNKERARDEVLARHMDKCQNATRRRSSRKRSRPGGKTGESSDCMLEDPEALLSPKKRRASKGRGPAEPSMPQTAEQSASLDDIEEWQYEDRVDDWIEFGISKMKDMNERDKSETPPGEELHEGGLLIPAWLNDRLFSYQRLGVKWLWQLHQQEAGGIVGDEMGLGKTVQVCGFLGAMAASRKLKSTLIICPATMLQHWLRELAVWAPGLRRILMHKSGETDNHSRTISTKLLRGLDSWLKKARADRVHEPIDEDDFNNVNVDSFVGTGYVIVTTYENIRRFPDIWTTHNWSYVVLDEGQKLKNPDADITLACKRLRTPHRLLLSGTPIQNDLRELWSLFDFVFPGRLGTLPAFESEFAEPIKKGGYANASPMQVQLAYRCALVLRDLINPYLLRRRKKDVKEVSRMPSKTEQVLFCRLSKRQRSLYESYLQSDEVRNILRGSPQLLRSITLLRKICNHPDLVIDPEEAADNYFFNASRPPPGDVDSDDESEDDMPIDSEEALVERAGKLEVLAKILPLWKKQGHRVLIFCQWKKMLNIIERFTRLQGWKFARLDGNTSVASRQRLVDNFNSNESYFGFLMTTRTGGVGLNLTGADRIILYDPDWNPQTDSQARERAWRFGQKNAVTVYRLITAGTIEEKIYQRQIFKTALTNRVLQDPRQRRLFSQRDLRDFFTLKTDDGTIIKGGHRMTETGELTKGRGVVDPDAVQPEDEGAEDNTETLETVMKSKGLAGVFDHDFVEATGNKSISVQEMEEKAKRVAREAARAIKESASGSARFEPTFTGAAETRFGYSNRPHDGMPPSANGDSHEQGFGGSGSVGVHRSKVGTVGSSGLLAGLRRSSAPSVSSNREETEKYADLMKRIRNYIKRMGGETTGRGPTTDEILRQFKHIPDSEAAIFRSLLKKVAVVEKGKWCLRP